MTGIINVQSTHIVTVKQLARLSPPHALQRVGGALAHPNQHIPTQDISFRMFFFIVYIQKMIEHLNL
jgi:hypothetical protein